MCNNDVVLDIIKYEPVKVGSNLYERTAKRFPVYIESIRICQYSSVVTSRYQETMFGGSISCLVALMVLDFGRVINLT